MKSIVKIPTERVPVAIRLSFGTVAQRVGIPFGKLAVVKNEEYPAQTKPWGIYTRSGWHIDGMYFRTRAHAAAAAYLAPFAEAALNSEGDLLPGAAARTFQQALYTTPHNGLSVDQVVYSLWKSRLTGLCESDRVLADPDSEGDLVYVVDAVEPDVSQVHVYGEGEGGYHILNIAEVTIAPPLVAVDEDEAELETETDGE